MSRILLVDDDIAEISSVKRVLMRGGHQPALATNASDAMAAISYERPELLIVSATCENGEALALARRLPRDVATASIPILLLGDADSPPDGARRLARPLDPEQLLAEINAALGPAGALSLEEPAAAPPAPAAQAPKPKPALAPLGKVQPARAIATPGAVAPPGAPPGARPGAKPAAPAPAARKPATPPAGATALSEPLPLPAPAPDAAASRRAAADALRARAEELRRSRPASSPAPAPAPSATPASAPAPSAAASPKPAPTSKPAPNGRAERTTLAAPLLVEPAAARAPRPSLAESLDLEEGELEATLARSRAPRDGVAAPEDPDVARQQAADDALRALEEEASTHAAELARARRAERQSSDAEAAADAAAEKASDERALQEAIETARREAFEAARRELQEQARSEAAEAARLVQAEARARQEAVQSAQREAQELAQQRARAEQRAHAAEEQLQAMRAQLEDERRKAEERVATVMQRAVQEEEAAEELRRIAEDELRRRGAELLEGRAAEEDKLREAIASAQAELAEARRTSEEEARRRAEAEAALQRLHQERRRAPEEPPSFAADEPPASRPESFTPPPFFAPFDGAEAAPADALPPDPTEDAARRRVAAMRSGPAEELALGPPTDILAVRPDAPPAAPLPPEEPARVMPPPPPALRSGELNDLPLPRLLAMAARAKLDGRIDLAGEVSRAIWFEGGRVVGATSADPSERVEEIALRLGLITRDQHRQVAQATASLPSRRAALLLLERGFLKATELTTLVRRRTEEVVFGAFGEEGGRFRWNAVEVPPEERTSLERGALALAIEGVRRRWRAPRVDALLGGPATLLAPVAGAPAAAELGLGPEERRVVALADGLRALDEIVQASPLDPLSTRQVLAALVVVGALGVRVLHAGRPRGQAAASIDLARVKDKLEQVRRADYFTVLGVGRLCTPHEVREAAERLLAEFDPRRYAGAPDEGLPARLAEILQVIQDARAVLADDRLRDEYLRGLGDAG